MKFTTPAGDFLECLKPVYGRAKGNSIEILNHIRLDVEGQQLTMMGHDLAASCESYLGVDDPADGSCAVPSAAIVQLVGSLPKSSHVVVELDGQTITLKAGRSRYKLPVLDAKEFPNRLECDGEAAIELSAQDVESLFVRARQALDPRDARPFGQGLYLHMVDGGLCSAAISLYHFARHRTDAKLSRRDGVIVPLGAVDEIAKICRGGGYLTISDRTIAVEANGRRLCSKLIEERYPEYTRHLPPIGSNYVDIDRAQTLAAVRRLTSIAIPQSVVDLSIGDNEIVLSLAGTGEGIEAVQCSSEVKIDALVSIAATRLIEALEMPKGEVLQLHFQKGSLMVRIHDPSDPTAIFVESTRIPRGFRAEAA